MLGILSLNQCEKGRSLDIQANPFQKYTLSDFLNITGAGGLNQGTNGFTVYTAWSKQSGGVRQVYQWNPDSKKHKQITHFKEGIDWSSLSPDGNYIIVGVSKGGNEQSKLWLYETKSGKGSMLKDQGASKRRNKAKYGGIHWHRDSRYFFYSSNLEREKDFDIYQYDIANQKSTKLYDSKGYNIVRESNKTGDTLIILYYKSNVESRPFLFHIPTKKITPILWNKQQPHIFYDFVFSQDEKQIYFLSNLFTDYASLLRYDMTSHKAEPVLKSFENPWEIIDLKHDPDRRSFAITVNENAYHKVYFTSPDNNWKITPFKPLDEGMYSIKKITKDNIFFSFQSSKVVPNSYYISRPFESAKPVQATFSSSNGIPVNKFYLPKLIHYKSFDGLNIPAFLYLPPNYKNGHPIPFIIHAHGGPEGQFKPYFSREYQYLLSRGFGILAPNVRGSAGYGKIYINLDNYKKRMDSVKDYYHATKWLIENKYTRQGMLGIRGGSYGGFIVMAMITEYPELFSAAVDIVGIVNFVTFLKKTRIYRRAIREVEYGPLTDIPFLTSISPIHKIDRIKTPLLVIHGKNDPRVPVEEAYQVINGLKKLDRKVESIIFEDEGHGVRKLSNRLIAYKKIADWFKDHLLNK